MNNSLPETASPPGQRTLSALYHANLRSEVTRRLGVEWHQPEHGIAEIAGIDADVLAEFSQRTHDVDRRLGEKLERFGEGLGREPSDREKSHDLVLSDGRRVQVKARVTSEPPKAGQLQTSPFRSWDFDLAAFVLFRDYDYVVRRAVLLPVEVVQARSTFRSHVNGSVVMMRGALLDHKDAESITDRLRAAASQD